MKNKDEQGVVQIMDEEIWGIDDLDFSPEADNYTVERTESDEDEVRKVMTLEILAEERKKYMIKKSTAKCWCAACTISIIFPLHCNTNLAL